MNLLVITTIRLKRRRRRLLALAVQQTAGRENLYLSREERKARRDNLKEANKRSFNDEVENKEKTK